MNNLYKRPMFRKGGSADGGITSGLQAPRQGYQGTGNASDQNVRQLNMNQNMADFLRNASIGDLKAAADEMYQPKERPNYAKRRFGDLMIDFGIDIASRTPMGDGIGGAISTALAAAKDPFEKFKASRAGEETAMDIQADNLDDRRSDMFKSLIEGQSEILGSDTGGKTYRDLEIARQLEKIIPKIYDLEAKIADGTASQDDIVQLDILKTQKNNYTKSNPVTEGAIELFIKSSQGQTLFASITEELFDNNPTGYKNEQDPQLYMDAIEQIKKILGQFSGGGRTGYANGEMVEEQITETETMAPGPMGDASNNLISYDQLRARLPAEITDDIVELMSNSAEALEDFAMISTQADVDQFNRKYSVNLVLPAEA
jgi:hypothetical protein